MKFIDIYFATISITFTYVSVPTGQNSKTGGLVWQAYFSQSHFQMS